MDNILRGLTHSFATNLSAGRINNADATLLVLESLGGVAKVGQILKVLRGWRPGLSFGYLFNTSAHGGYGFVGGDFHTTHNRVYHFPGFVTEEHESDRRTYWYRSGHGTYTITAEGYRRLAELDRG